MEKEIKDLELIESYMDQKLNDEEKLHFEERLKKDEEFFTLYQDLKWVIPGIKYTAKKNLKEELAVYAKDLPSYTDYELESDFDLETDFGLEIQESNLKVSARNEAQRSTNSSSFKWSYGIAAAIALMIASTFLFFNQTAPEKAFNLAYNDIGEGAYKFLEDTENPSISRGETPSQEILDVEQQAYLSYQNFDYEEAVKNFESIKTELGSKDPKFLFYMGNAYLAKSDLKNAIDTFNELLALPKNLQKDYASRAKWYLGLSHLKNDNFKQARIIFEDLATNSNDSYKEKAKQVLEEVNWGIF